MKNVQRRQEIPDPYRNPSEYGAPERPNGWTLIEDPRLGEQRIYLTSKGFKEAISKRYNLKKIVDLRDIPEEVFIDGKQALRKFTDKLELVSSITEPILIHCQQVRIVHL